MPFNPTCIEMSRSTSGLGCGGSCFKLSAGSKKPDAWSSAVSPETAKSTSCTSRMIPTKIKPWSPDDLRPLKGRHQDWITAVSKLSPPSFPQDDHNCPHGERSRTIGRGACMVRLRSPCGTYDPTRFGDQVALAMRLLEWSLMSTLVGCNEPLRIAPPPLAQPPPILKTPISPGFGTRGLGPASRDLNLKPTPPSRTRAPGRTC